MLTTAEAAEILDISTRRVIALIEAGDLAAERFGRQWMVDERSVTARAMQPKLAGRPKLGQKDLLALSSHTLMNRDHPVLDFTYDRKSKRVRIERVYDEARWAPLGAGGRARMPRNAGKQGKASRGVSGRAPTPLDADGWALELDADKRALAPDAGGRALTSLGNWRPPVPNEIDLALWLQHRYMPPLRPEAARVLRETGETSTDMLMLSSLGLNLSDQYWFRPIGAPMSWHDVNFFENDYEATRPHRSPDSSTPGALEKWWEKRDGQNWLVKTSSSAEEREPYNELLATRLFERLLEAEEFVPYELEQHDGRTCSACPTFVAPDTEFVSANDVAAYFRISEGRDFYTEYARACEELGIQGARRALAKMIVCDHVMANFDRHRANFGLVRNTETLDGWKVAPLFDNGAAFFSRATVGDLARGRFTWSANPFDEYPLAQLSRVQDMSWYDPGMLDGFIDEVLEVLGRNPHLPEEMVARMAFHVQRNIDAVNDLHAERVR